MLLESFVDSNSPETSTCLLFIILLNEQWSFSKIYCTPWVLLTRSQVVRNHFLVLLAKEQQVDMVQLIGHLQ